MSAFLSALCVVIYLATGGLYAYAGSPLVAALWGLGALIWVYTFSQEVTR